MCDKSSKTSTENNNYVDFIKVKNLSKNYKFFNELQGCRILE